MFDQLVSVTDMNEPLGRSDSEFESIVAANNKAGDLKLKKAGQKRKPDAARTTTAASKKKEAHHPFELFPEDESLAKNYSAQDQLGSSITQRVADGITRRAVDLEGAFFLELRVYNTDDIRSELKEEKWKKALLAVKAQIDTDTPQWEYLQKLSKHLKTLFDDADVKYFHNKKV
ncbi:hypothetical protein MSG28_007439 [Choristoneura fumiferana]|uniref:Uncharacterized protein n=1 Tax=Choristoneura fumiferana TaxID=7141 RepID=A0ACC0JXE5_CHOFU|nr:hypothetical protein MSG28_007439 [Choristoneura fumiferana]